MRVTLMGILLLTATAAGARAEESGSPGPGWKEASRDGDLVIWTKDDAEGGARKLVAQAEIEASPQVVFNVVRDYENYPKFMPYVKEAKLVKTLGEAQFQTYVRLSPPFADDRDYVIEVTLTKGTEENGGVFRSAWVARPELEREREDIVRVKLNTGSWTLAPLEGGKRTKATYSLHNHPGGSIPNWMVTRANTTVVSDQIKAVKARSAGPKR